MFYTWEASATKTCTFQTRLLYIYTFALTKIMIKVIKVIKYYVLLLLYKSDEILLNMFYTWEASATGHRHLHISNSTFIHRYTFAYISTYILIKIMIKVVIFLCNKKKLSLQLNIQSKLYQLLKI